jgi:putative restriction endonuclease
VYNPGIPSTVVRRRSRRRLAKSDVEKKFEPGTTGWSARDLEDPAIEREWFRGSYEIVEGVLTKMPPAYFTGGSALYELMSRVSGHLKDRGIKARFAPKVEVIVGEIRVPRADAALLTDEDMRRQRKAAGKHDLDRALLLVPPTLIIESVSPGHEAHDWSTKKQ